MTNKIDLYWFSGTGNSLFITTSIKKKLDSLGYQCSITPLEIMECGDIIKDTTIGIIIPVAMQGTFPLVWDFLRDLPIVDNTELFLVDTLGTYSGGIKGPVKKIVKKKGFKPIGAVEIKMPNLFLKKKPNKNDKNKIEKALTNINVFCEKLDVNKAHWHDIAGYSTLLSTIYNN